MVHQNSCYIILILLLYIQYYFRIIDFHINRLDSHSLCMYKRVSNRAYMIAEALITANDCIFVPGKQRTLLSYQKNNNR